MKTGLLALTITLLVGCGNETLHPDINVYPLRMTLQAGDTGCSVLQASGDGSDQVIVTLVRTDPPAADIQVSPVQCDSTKCDYQVCISAAQAGEYLLRIDCLLPDDSSATFYGIHGGT